jgi:hydrogenase expression/formation protein HypE
VTRPAQTGWFGACPTPASRHDRILMGHGGGGTLSADLLRSVFLPGFANETLSRLEDQATLSLAPSITGTRIAFTTDSFVVHPIFFPGGDIGKLAINGTINDLAVGGAIPRWISAAFILEEGLPIEDLNRIVASMREACDEARVELVTGDTKVVDRGKGDQLFITTAGIGYVPTGRFLSISSARPGDRILVSGTIGDHGIAILSVREGLAFDTLLESDTAPLVDLTERMLEACPGIRCMRDPTRGGVLSALSELAGASRVGVRLSETAIPLRDEVRAACEILGLDPLSAACEGRLLAVASPDDADSLLTTMRAHPLGRHSAIIGEVVPDHPARLAMETRIGGERMMTLPAGEQLPRIC